MLFAQGAQLIMPSDSISLFDLESDPQYEKLAKRAKVIVDSLTSPNQQLPPVVLTTSCKVS